MATASVPHPSFTPDTTIASDEVNANFDALVDFLNDSVVHTDASKAFDTTKVPSVDADPSSANQLTRKSYVDAAITAALPRMTMGTYTGTTNGSSEVEVAHSLGALVTGAVVTTNGAVTPFGGANLEGKVTGGSTSTVTFRFWNGTSGWPSTAIKFHWIAWA